MATVYPWLLLFMYLSHVPFYISLKEHTHLSIFKKSTYVTENMKIKSLTVGLI